MTAFVLGALIIVHLFLKSSEISAELLDDNCGLTSHLLRNKRMTGGEDADILSSPWMVLLLGDSIAGGSLINSRFVLTAGHALSATFKKVRLGEYDRESIKDCTSSDCIPKTYDINITDSFIHPAFQSDNYRNDIALLQMGEEVIFSDYIRPICLLVNEQVGETISMFRVTGWGKTNSFPTSRILQTATLNYLDITECTDLFQSENDGTQICAGSLNSDTCSGDSGGPLSAILPYGKTNRVFQFGIISYGTLTCDAPSLYTNVTHYMDWIVNITSTYS
ncbi:spaetzle-processing enzyme-like [Drosophila subpulchrella]|uniref:spaetzle-processing enzyme-like n=1 Tax=Drosophila subpulchrella TaxID=1486046 RepID=UPI0018A14F86|nr:spaetzle-processing enzyme-like [Drosophila subpulchrella]